MMDILLASYGGIGRNGISPIWNNIIVSHITVVEVLEYGQMRPKISIYFDIHLKKVEGRT